MSWPFLHTRFNSQCWFRLRWFRCLADQESLEFVWFPSPWELFFPSCFIPSDFGIYLFFAPLPEVFVLNLSSLPYINLLCFQVLEFYLDTIHLSLLNYLFHGEVSPKNATSLIYVPPIIQAVVALLWVHLWFQLISTPFQNFLL